MAGLFQNNGRLAAAPRAFDQSQLPETFVAVIADVGGRISVAGRLAGAKHPVAFPAVHPHRPHATDLRVVDVDGAVELALAEHGRGVDFKPFGQNGKEAVDSAPGLRAGAVEADAMMLVLDSERLLAEPAFLELELPHGHPFENSGDDNKKSPKPPRKCGNFSPTARRHLLLDGALIAASHKIYKRPFTALSTEILSADYGSTSLVDITISPGCVASLTSSVQAGPRAEVHPGDSLNRPCDHLSAADSHGKPQQSDSPPATCGVALPGAQATSPSRIPSEKW